ncbi:alpha/beta hydrolase [Allokutzneria multivorans]|uniref:Alpha/beta hydrolase n=1 Tax=Allokutzneria multivorans TaxID=1142134 RepID=A0ABP7TIV7_9PSEU
MDVDILGEPYRVRTLPLAPTQDGDEVVATLVHLPADSPGKGAVLYVHGWCDYFFQDHLARHFASQGYDFYAVDLRRYGRSIRPDQLPTYTTDLTEYFEEIDAAIEVIRSEHGHQRLVLLAHSTGGLIAPLWAHEHRASNLIDALVLNSPWLDLAEPWLTRTVGTAVNNVVGRFAPRLVVKPGLAPTYGHSLSSTHHGEWTYDNAWKPSEHFPVRAGWLRAVRLGHAQVHRGLDIRVPVLVEHSSRSLLHRKKWEPAAMTADTVLDVEQIARWAPKLGRDVTTVPIEDGMHDLFLSPEPVRNKALAEIDSWLAQRLGRVS